MILSSKDILIIIITILVTIILVVALIIKNKRDRKKYFDPSPSDAVEEQREEHLHHRDRL